MNNVVSGTVEDEHVTVNDYSRSPVCRARFRGEIREIMSLLNVIKMGFANYCPKIFHSRLELFFFSTLGKYLFEVRMRILKKCNKVDALTSTHTHSLSLSLCLPNTSPPSLSPPLSLSLSLSLVYGNEAMARDHMREERERERQRGGFPLGGREREGASEATSQGV